MSNNVAQLVEHSPGVLEAAGLIPGWGEFFHLYSF